MIMSSLTSLRLISGAGGLCENHHWVRGHPSDLIWQGALGLLGNDQQQCEDDRLSVYHQHCSNHLPAHRLYSSRGLSHLQHPLLLSFLVQLDFFLSNLNDLGLTIQVYSRGPGAYVTGATGDVTLNAS